MKCSNCGASVGNGSKFCPNCGSSIAVSQPNNHSQKGNDSQSASGIVGAILSRPKLIVAVLIAIIAILALMTMFGGNDSNKGYSSNGGYMTEVFGVSFHIPDGFKESYHSGPFSSGETVDFQSDGYDDLEIEVSPQRHVDLTSKHVKVKTQKSIAGKEGTLVYYDSNRVSFYYNDNGYTIKLNTNSPDHDELFASVIV